MMYTQRHLAMRYSLRACIVIRKSPTQTPSQSQTSHDHSLLSDRGHQVPIEGCVWCRTISSCDSSKGIATIVIKVCHELSLNYSASRTQIARKICPTFDFGSKPLPRKLLIVLHKSLPVLHVIHVLSANLSWLNGKTSVAEIAFQVSKAYAHTGKDHRTFLVIVPFTFSGEISFSEGIASHPLEERRLYAF